MISIQAHGMTIGCILGKARFLTSMSKIRKYLLVGPGRRTLVVTQEVLKLGGKPP